MFLFLPIVLCAFQHFAATEAFANCGKGSLSNTKCVLLKDCEVTVARIKELFSTNAIEHHSFMTDYVNSVTCGFEGNDPKICCPIRKPKLVKRTLLSVEDETAPDTTTDSATDTTTDPAIIFEEDLTPACGNFLWSKSLTKDDHPTDLGEFPWLALLEYNTIEGTKIRCGGVLVSDRHVLTAARCVNPSLNLTSVRLGEHDLNMEPDCNYEGFDLSMRYCADKSIVVGIDELIPHEKYRFDRDPRDCHPKTYDIALIRLKESVLSDYVKPICLPNDSPVVKGKFLSAGWGAAPSNDFLRSSVKRMSRLIGVDNGVCDEKYGRQVQEDVICAQSKSLQTACLADFGGPLMSITTDSRMTVEGIFAPASNEFCLISGVPGTYTNVREYTDWIEENMD